MPKAQLSFFEILSVTIGTILTTAVFLLPGELAAEHGFSSLYIWIAIALLTIPIGLSFAELAGMFSQSGGPFLFVRKAFGDFAGFVAGWSTWVYSTIAIAALAKITGSYFSFLFPLPGWGMALFSVGVIGIFTLINMFGAKQGAKVDMLMIWVSLGIALLFVVLGFGTVDSARFANLPTASLPALALAGILAMELFIGWESATIISEEVRSPKRLIPRALVWTIFIATIVYLSVIFVFLGNADIGKVSESLNPLAETAKSFAGAFAPVFSVGAVIISLAVVNSWILTVARLPYAMAKGKLFLKYFEKQNKYGAPAHALLLQFLFASAAVFFELEHILQVLLSVAFILYIVTMTALIKLRKTNESSFKVPKILPYIGIALLLGMLVFVPWKILAVGLVLLFTGLPAFFVVKLFTDRTFVEAYWDRLGGLMDIYSRSLLEGDVLEKVIINADIRKKDTVLDYGCGSGHIVDDVAKLAGKVVAADLSVNQLQKAVSSVHKKQEPTNIIFVKLSKPAPFEKETFDRIVCTLATNYFVNPIKEFTALSRVLKKNGKASFLAVRAAGVPEHDFLHKDGSVKSVMIKAGFSDVKIERRKKGHREYIFIVVGK